MGIAVEALLLLPVMFTTACAPAFLVTAACGTLALALRLSIGPCIRWPRRGDLRTRLLMASILGGWLATTLFLVLDNMGQGGGLLLWWVAWAGFTGVTCLVPDFEQ